MPHPQTVSERLKYTKYQLSHLKYHIKKVQEEGFFYFCIANSTMRY